MWLDSYSAGFVVGISVVNPINTLYSQHEQFLENLCITPRYRKVLDVVCRCYACNGVTCMMLVVNHGCKLQSVSAHMAETYVETEELIT